MTQHQTRSGRAKEAVFATSHSELHPSISSMDPAERIEFTRLSSHRIIRFDKRSDEELTDVALHHDSPMERERALWELGDRSTGESFELFSRVASNDPDERVRISVLWLIQKISGNAAIGLIQPFLEDHELEVRDWAHLLIREMTGNDVRETGLHRPLREDTSNPFDQTLPLLIAGYARVGITDMGLIQATLSPLWFESIMGRVMACTREETFENDLVIEKRIKEYHPDKTDHFEIFKFRGLSQELSPGVFHHTYESQAQHTFYPSGKVEHGPEDPLSDVVTNLARSARTVAFHSDELGRKVVESVRGRYMGYAFVSLERILRNGFSIGPGEVQLSSPTHPTAGPMTNTFLFGTFKGKLSSLSRDEYLDVNTERCHGTLEGELDIDLDGVADKDPFDLC